MIKKERGLCFNHRGRLSLCLRDEVLPFGWLAILFNQRFPREACHLIERYYHIIQAIARPPGTVLT